MNAVDKVVADLTLLPGQGATMYNGRDSYPYYICEALPNDVYGIYSPNSHFDDSHPWEGGVEVVDAYVPNHPAEHYIKFSYGKWWEVSKDGKTRIRRFTGKYHHLSFKGAYSYRDPSF